MSWIRDNKGPGVACYCRLLHINIDLPMLYTKIGCRHHHPPTKSLLISRIKLFMGHVR